MAGLIRITGDRDLAEDCVQDAVERALASWPRDGVPANPAAWLTTTAHRRALDVLRRRRTETEKLKELTTMATFDAAAAGSGPDPDPHGEVYRDDVLRLLFTCCHPALPLTGQVALTLKTVAGLSTREVQLLPTDDEVHGLRALLLLQHARRAARTDAAGDLVPMDEQDRSSWDRAMITAGLASLRAARETGRPAGSYRLQAEIAATHATAPEAAATDWTRLVAGYDALLQVQPSPVVALNRGGRARIPRRTGGRTGRAGRRPGSGWAGGLPPAARGPG